MAHGRIPTRNLTVAIWNAQGIKRKKIELEHFLSQHNVDILLANETHLRGGEHFKLRNMVSYRTDRQLQQGGGTAVFLRNSFIHHQEEIPNLTDMEATAITVSTSMGQITFVATYLRPGNNLTRADLEAVLNLSDVTLVGGDLNAKHPLWHSRQTNPRGNALLSLADDLHFEVHAPTEPTYIPFNRRHQPDVLDVVLTKHLPATFDLTVVNDLRSDHQPVLIHFRRLTLPVEEKYIKNVDWDSYRRFLTNTVNPTLRLQTTEDITTAVDYLTTKLQVASKRAQTTTIFRSPYNAELPPLLQELKHQKNRYRRRWQTYRNPRDRQQMHRLQRELRNRLVEWRQEQWEDTMDSFQLHQKQEWQLVKAIRKPQQPRRALTTPQGMQYDPLQLAEIFVETFENQNTPVQYDLTHQEQQDEHNTTEFVRNFRQQPTNHRPLLATPTEVTKIIQHRKGSSAPGADNVTNDHLKNMPRKPLVLLTRIINSCLLLNFFPPQWKLARLMPIPKPGKDHKHPGNYRPISLLSTMSKTLERVIHSRITDPLTADGTIRPEQFGFQKKLSAELQVLRVVEQVTSNLNTSTATAAVFLDWEKAYDKVWPDKLIQKMLLHSTIPDCYVKLIDSFLRDRTVFVAINGQRSSRKTLAAGLPQGSVLSPTLFNIYINDIPLERGVRLAQYADDTAFFATGRQHFANVNKLQRQLQHVTQWCRTNKMMLNGHKTTAVYFTRRRPMLQQLTIHGHRIPWSPAVKYLGVTLDAQVYFAKHIQDKRRKCLQMAQALTPFFTSKELRLPTKIRLYQATVLPALLYGSTAWGIASDTQLNQLQIVQNRVLRWILRAPPWERIRDLHAATQMKTIKEAIRERAIQLFRKIENLRHTIPQLQELGTARPRPNHRFKVPLSLVEL